MEKAVCSLATNARKARLAALKLTDSGRLGARQRNGVLVRGVLLVDRRDADAPQIGDADALLDELRINK